MSYPLRHISIRVPWHDNGWCGTVCKNPELNDSCLRLPRISAHRSDIKKMNQCESVKGKRIDELKQELWPCCVAERAMFMSPFEYTRNATHPYTKTSPETHGHFAETPLRHPAYSAPAVPFNWLFREQLEARAEEYGLNFCPEPDLGFKTEWVQHKDNQLALLDCFFGHIQPRKSLCFFYAKETPFVEDHRRVIIGVGYVNHIGESTEYFYSGKGALRSVLWERMVQHSIRPDYKDGFLLPYYDAIEYAENNGDFDPSTITAFAPANYFNEFSYASELVSHDAAIEALHACVGAITRAKELFNKSYAAELDWLNDRLGELWKMRGPCPGLGAVLCAFGIEHGMFIGREIEAKLGENEDPWPIVNKAFEKPQAVLSRASAQKFTQSLRDTWRKLPDERRALLKLLSRFNIQPEQATLLYVKEERERANFNCSDADIIKNPYLIYELTRLNANPISVSTVDRGLFPELIVRQNHPLPKPSALDDNTDPRRIRAFTIAHLEQAATEGHTLQRRGDVIRAIRDMDIKPECPVHSDMLDVFEPGFDGVILKKQLQDATQCYQLARFHDIGEVIRKNINKRRSGSRHRIDTNWRALLDCALPAFDNEDREQEEYARKEKTAALKELAESRFSVLIGPAGTGKTTLLAILCAQEKISQGDVLLLAPTGKARVKMEQMAKEKKLNLKGYTIAQFLSGCGRYDGTTGRYHLSDAPKETPAKTVIVDECSMLTEEMLAALLDALKGVERLILVGDPRQLPPIGAGRPFVDIVSLVTPKNIRGIFPRVGQGYAELTIRRRQAGQQREDLQLAEWFSGSPLEPGEDEIFDNIFFHSSAKNISYKTWETPQQFERAILDSLVEELKLASEDDISGFDESLGATTYNGYRYFNVKKAAIACENWQILSPVRKSTHGVSLINRLIHQRYRSETVEFARREKNRKIPKPMGSEQIVYGDKVINIANHRRNKVYPADGASCYIANGDVGMVVGQWRTKNMSGAPWLLKVEFSSQPGFAYDFTEYDFGDESDPYLELAYALTIHKAQGSEFGKVILVLPNPCRLLSRELLYTALTRQRERIVMLCQGQLSDIRRLSGDEYSETAKRLTNLFIEPKLVEHKGKFYEERLIHHTLRGEMVRSKSELTIADRLHTNGIDYTYEQPLTIGQQTKYPDFTIDDTESGRKYYWEHCGMLTNPQYRERWDRKLAWYHKNGIEEYEKGGGPNGILIITRDNEYGGISSVEIENVIKSAILNC